MAMRLLRRCKGSASSLLQPSTYVSDGHAMCMAGSGPSISEGTLAASQQDRLWVVDTLPTQWTVPVQTVAGPGQMLEKRSTCELEADACVEHVLNRADVRRSCTCCVFCGMHRDCLYSLLQ